MHHKKLGVALLQDAVVLIIQASEILGIRGLLVRVISPEAKGFYEHHGFTPSVTQPLVFYFVVEEKIVRVLFRISLRCDRVFPKRSEVMTTQKGYLLHRFFLEALHGKVEACSGDDTVE